MALKEFGIGVILGGVVASSLKSSLNFTNINISKIEKNIKDLNKNKIDIKNFKKLNEALESCL